MREKESEHERYDSEPVDEVELEVAAEMAWEDAQPGQSLKSPEDFFAELDRRLAAKRS